MSSIDRYTGHAQLPARVQRQANRDIAAAVGRAAVQRVRDDLEMSRMAAAGHARIGHLIGLGAHAAVGLQQYPFLEGHLQVALLDTNEAMGRVVRHGA